VIQTSKFLQNVELNVDEDLAMQFDIGVCWTGSYFKSLQCKLPKLIAD
jgi:hypothetical protein